MLLASHYLIYISMQSSSPTTRNLIETNSDNAEPNHQPPKSDLNQLLDFLDEPVNPWFLDPRSGTLHGASDVEYSVCDFFDFFTEGEDRTHSHEVAVDSLGINFCAGAFGDYFEESHCGVDGIVGTDEDGVARTSH